MSRKKKKQFSLAVPAPGVQRTPEVPPPAGPARLAPGDIREVLQSVARMLEHCAGLLRGLARRF